MQELTLIGYMEGSLLRNGEDRILLLANQVGYEVLLPSFVHNQLENKAVGDPIRFYIFYHQTERQPRPVLIGFNTEEEKEFFQLFISVEDIGPLKAVKALDLPMQEIAAAIEAKNVAGLRRMKGIGQRTAQKIIATLSGKMERFLAGDESARGLPPNEEFVEAVLEVLVSQLGHKATDAKRMVAEALARNPGLATPEELFDEVYRGDNAS